MTVHIGPHVTVFTVDYRRDQPARRAGLLNRGFWINNLPRPLLTCRARGHRPTVDGTGPHAPGLAAYRWVCCDRCGLRPDPQGDLDPLMWDVGAPYTGPLPGPWPTRPSWTLGGQLVVGDGFSGVGAEVKVGNGGSEHTLAGHVALGRVGALFLHTEDLGTWLQRRLNPTGYDSRVTGVSVSGGRLSWKVWAKRDHWSRDDPKWMQGSVVVDPRDLVLGPKRYAYEDAGEPVTRTVRMPHGDDREVRLQLQRVTAGRARGRKTESWSVDWDSTPGIPTEPGDRGRIGGAGETVTAAAVNAGTWPMEATAGIAARLTRDRARSGWADVTT